MKKSSIDSQEEARARLKEKMENKRRKQSKSLSKNPMDRFTRTSVLRVMSHAFWSWYTERLTGLKPNTEIL